MLSTPLELVLALALALNGAITSGRRNWSSRFRCAKLARTRGFKKKMTPKTSTSTDFRLSRPWHQFDITSTCILLGICYICHLIIRRGSKKKGFSRVSCFCEREFEQQITPICSYGKFKHICGVGWCIFTVRVRHSWISFCLNGFRWPSSSLYSLQ